MEGEVINLWKRVEEIKHVRDYTDSIWWYYISSDFSPCSSSFMWTLSFNFFQILRLQKDVLSAAAVQTALPATSSSVPPQVPWALPTSKVPWALPTSKVPWAMPTSKVSAKMPSCATSPTMPAEVPTQKQVEASAFIWIRKGWRQLTHPAPQLHLHLLFKAYHGYRRSFSTLQLAICLWWLLTARDIAFLRLLRHFPLGGQLRKHHSTSEGRATALLLGTIMGLSPCILCLSPGDGFLSAGQLLLILYFLSKLQFLCVVVKMFSFFKSLLLIVSYHHLGLFTPFFDAKF